MGFANRHAISTNSPIRSRDFREKELLILEDALAKLREYHELIEEGQDDDQD